MKTMETDLIYLRCEADELGHGLHCDGPKEIARLRRIVRVDNSLAKQLSQSMAINARLNEENKRLREENARLEFTLDAYVERQR